MKASTALLIGLLSASIADGSNAQKRDAEYRAKDCAFRYPASFKLSTADHGRTIRLSPQSRASYWSDTITIRKQNKRTNECDLPQSTSPDGRDTCEIAGRAASAYSGEDAAMNRYTTVKGCMIETMDSCWRFELVRTGRPFEKFDLAPNEMKRLNEQRDIDSKSTKSAFNMVLNTFVIVPR